MHVNKPGLLLALATSVLMVTGAMAGNFTLFNTGVDATHAVLPGGSIDPHWSILSGANVTGTNAFTTTAVPGSWFAAPTGATGTASWIAPFADQNGAAANSGPFSTYEYQTTFDLTGFNSATASIFGQLATDNNLTDILINGVSTGITTGFAGFGALTNFNINSGFVSGINTLDFFLVNGANSDVLGGPTGLIVDSLVGTAQVPESATLSLVVIALGTLALMSFRKRNALVA
jgi:hypothetical protein